MVNTKQYTDKLTYEELSEISEAVVTIHEGNKENVDGDSMRLLFKYWNFLWPRYKQDINCGSCRKAVLKFFSILVSDIHDNG